MRTRYGSIRRVVSPTSPKLAARPPALAVTPVGFGVNDPRKDDETLIAPVKEAAG